MLRLVVLLALIIALAVPAFANEAPVSPVGTGQEISTPEKIEEKPAEKPTIQESMTIEGKDTIGDTQPLDKIKMIKEYFKVTNMRVIFLGIIDLMLANFPKEKAEIISKEINTEKVEEKLVPTYSLIFSDEQIKSIVKFFQSDAGKKLVEMTPEINRLITNACREHVREIIEEKGITPPSTEKKEVIIPEAEKQKEKPEVESPEKSKEEPAPQDKLEELEEKPAQQDKPKEVKEEPAERPAK
ncbi:MAG: DUF2059 domain-containing protein [Candidatus Eremiobacteraeota bacterium]|nr:DUF2059 domain-containing protein [Candidatus Eremiobacteraeota bacterium]